MYNKNDMTAKKKKKYEVFSVFIILKMFYLSREILMIL
jgi:hypothetical protein